MKKNIIIIAVVILVIIICIYIFNTGVREARVYKNEQATGQGK